MTAEHVVDIEQERDPYRLIIAARSSLDSLRRGLEFLDGEGGWSQVFVREPAYGVAAMNTIAAVGHVLATLTGVLAASVEAGEDVADLRADLIDFQRELAMRREGLPS